MLEVRGGKGASSVYSKTNFLIVGDNAGSKLEKARKLNVKIMNEDQLDKIIN